MEKIEEQIQKMLRNKIIAAGKDVVENFIGMELSPNTTKAEMEDLFDQTYVQMPNDILYSFAKQYLFPIHSKITKQILAFGHIQGYVLELEDGEEVGLPRFDLMDCIKNGSFEVENAIVVEDSIDGIRWNSLRGKECSLKELPIVCVDLGDPLVFPRCHRRLYWLSHRRCGACCPAYMEAIRNGSEKFSGR